uniref:Uncharacterized protein n=1 Tax=Glossina morsitans morsitans TaxID=37546 RepID=A0A1B0FEB5_GLOMM
MVYRCSNKKLKSCNAVNIPTKGNSNSLFGTGPTSCPWISFTNKGPLERVISFHQHSFFKSKMLWKSENALSLHDHNAELTKYDTMLVKDGRFVGDAARSTAMLQ